MLPEKLMYLLLATVVIGRAVPVQASIFVGQTSNDLANGAIRIVDPAGDQPRFTAVSNLDYTQSFRVPANLTVDKIIIEIEAAFAGESVTIGLFEVANTNAEPLRLGRQLATEQYTFDSSDAFKSQPFTEVLFQWDLDPNVGLTAADAAGYALQLDVGNRETVSWTGFRNNPYAAGRIYRMQDGSLTSGFGNLDGQGDGTLVLIPVVPEPSTLAFLLLGGLGAFRRRK